MEGRKKRTDKKPTHINQTLLTRSFSRQWRTFSSSPCRDSFRHTLAARARINQVNGRAAFAAEIRLAQK